jgi:hypothetical protein
VRGSLLSVVFLFFWCQHSFAAEWSVVVFAGIDEEEIAHYSDPLVEQILNAELAENVELLMQVDSVGTSKDARYLKRANSPLQAQNMPEIDSADVKNFKDFLSWSQSHITGSKVLFLVMAHSWGWKGLLQDFGVPGKPEENTMMPVREFSRAMQEARFHPDVMMLDACIMGSAEALDYLVETSDFVVASQKETPYAGFPYLQLIKNMERNLSAQQLAKLLPGMHVKAFVRGGQNVLIESEYFFTASVAIQSAKWKHFRRSFAELVKVLKASDFKKRLKNDPEWLGRFVDADSHVDLIEFLQQIEHSDLNVSVTKQARLLLDQIGYPPKARDFNKRSILIPPDALSFEIEVQADELMKPGTDEDPTTPVLEKLKRAWNQINQDLQLPGSLQHSLIEKQGHRIFKVFGKVDRAFEVRPWLAGAQSLEVRLHTLQNIFSFSMLSEQDHVEVIEFPETSFMLAEAHTQGSPFVHGIGLGLKPHMDFDEERSMDPVWKISGPKMYRKLSWNQNTGWADLILFKR